ncbi:hypothetical protein Hanom_Chr11g01026741 [Helianthus anomalus]
MKNTDELSNTNGRKRTCCSTFANINERTRPLFMFMFIHLTKQTEFLVRVRSFIIKRDQTNFPANGSQTVR